MERETIIVERDAGIVTVTLNRPDRKNAANGVMWQELYAVLQEVARRRDDRVLVMTGAGGAFCSGADITDPVGVSGDSADPHIVRLQFLGAVVQNLFDLPKPSIAKVRGAATGAGLSLALCCDLTAVASTARLSEIFARRGLSLDGGSSWLLPRLVGLHRAKELAYFADTLSGEEAASLGLVNRAVPEDELDALVDEWARRLAAGPPLALSMIKRQLNDASGVSMAQALEGEARCQAVNLSTEDTREAMRAFVQKRDPHFTGR